MNIVKKSKPGLGQLMIQISLYRKIVVVFFL